MKVERIDFDEAAALAKAAAKDHVTIKETVTPTRWFGYRDGFGALVAVAGLLVKRTHARIRAVYVVPGFRGQGISTAMMDRLEWEARQLGCRSMDQLAAAPGWWVEDRGWTRVNRSVPVNDGRAWVEKDL